MNISLIIKNNPENDDDFGGGTYKLDFNNCDLKFLGDYLVIEVINGDEKVGHVFNLKTIKSYKIWQ
jgi:hypothetical protein